MYTYIHTCCFWASNSRVPDKELPSVCRWRLLGGEGEYHWGVCSGSAKSFFVWSSLFSFPSVSHLSRTSPLHPVLVTRLSSFLNGCGLLFMLGFVSLLWRCLCMRGTCNLCRCLSVPGSSQYPDTTPSSRFFQQNLSKRTRFGPRFRNTRNGRFNRRCIPCNRLSATSSKPGPCRRR